jgi:hypothetical protein
MPPSDSPNSPTEATPEPIATEILDEAERTFEREAQYAEMEAALEQDRERTFLSDGAL